MQEDLICVCLSVCVCACYIDYECKGYFFKELSQLLSSGIPRAHGLLRSHHGAHTPALTVLCWAVHLPRLLRVRRQHLAIADNRQTDEVSERDSRVTLEDLCLILIFYFFKRGHSNTPGTFGSLQILIIFTFSCVSELIYPPTKNTARHFTYVIMLSLCNWWCIHTSWTHFPQRTACTNEGLSHIYSSQLPGSGVFTYDVLIHSHFLFKKNFMIERFLSWSSCETVVWISATHNYQ